MNPPLIGSNGNSQVGSNSFDHHVDHHADHHAGQQPRANEFAPTFQSPVGSNLFDHHVDHHPDHHADHHADRQPRANEFAPTRQSQVGSNSFDPDCTPLTILLLGNYRPSLAIARYLRERGHRVIVGRNAPTAVELSRSVAERWLHPALLDDNPGLFIGALRAFLSERGDIDVVFPVSEKYALAFAREAPELPCPLAMVTAKTLLTCCDKGRMSQLAAEAGVPLAPWMTVNNLADLHARAREIGFPLVARPDDERFHFDKAHFIGDEAQLHKTFPKWPARHRALLLQRQVSGDRYNRYFVADGGKILCALDVRTLRTDRANGSGYGVEGESVEPLRVLDAPCAALIERLNYTGVGCAQFLLDASSGAVSFLEINARIGGNYAFTHYCGCNQVEPLLAIALGKAIETGRAALPPVIGRRYAWLYGDLIGWLGALDRREVGPVQALAWLARAARTLWRADMHLTMDRRDIRPSLRYGSRLVLATLALLWDEAQRLRRRLRTLLPI